MRAGLCGNCGRNLRGMQAGHIPKNGENCRKWVRVIGTSPGARAGRQAPHNKSVARGSSGPTSPDTGAQDIERDTEQGSQDGARPPASDQWNGSNVVDLIRRAHSGPPWVRWRHHRSEHPRIRLRGRTQPRQGNGRSSAPRTGTRRCSPMPEAGGHVDSKDKAIRRSQASAESQARDGSTRVRTPGAARGRTPRPPSPRASTNLQKQVSETAAAAAWTTTGLEWGGPVIECRRDVLTRRTDEACSRDVLTRRADEAC